MIQCNRCAHTREDYSLNECTYCALYDPDLAQGSSLDGIASILGIKRGNKQTDVELRADCRARMMALRKIRPLQSLLDELILSLGGSFLIEHTDARFIRIKTKHRISDELRRSIEHSVAFYGGTWVEITYGSLP